MKQFCLIGQNIKSSLSPFIHNSLFRIKKENSFYYFRPQSQFLPLQYFKKLNINGISITIPFKQKYKGHSQIIFDEGISKEKQIINTLIRNHNSDNFLGYNTDIFGISQCLKSYIDSQNNQNQHIAILIGTGATAQIFAYYFLKNNVKVINVNRTAQRMIKVKDQYKNIIKICQIQELNSNNSMNKKIVNKNVLIINTLPSKAVQQHKVNLESIIKRQVFESYNFQKLTFMDVNYRDDAEYLKNSILKQVSYQKHNIQLNFIKGIDMLIWQAIQQNRLFCFQQKYQQNEYDKQFGVLTQLLSQELNKMSNSSK